MKRVVQTFLWTGRAILVVLALSLAGGQPALAQSAPAVTEATVKALQEALIKQGITVATDGKLNDATRDAIRKYQSQHHLPVTGEPDQATLNKLGVVDQKADSSTTSENLAQGPKGDAKVQAQTQMMQGNMMNCQMMQGQMDMMQSRMQQMTGMMENMMKMLQGMKEKNL
jgi:hypothetical protein